jgi:hypothetical protein
MISIQAAKKIAGTGLEMFVVVFLLGLAAAYWFSPKGAEANAGEAAASGTAGLLPVQGTGNAQSSSIDFECVQSDKGDLIIEIDSKTGDYTFTSCQGGQLTITGKGKINSAECRLTLNDSGADPKKPDRRIYVNVNPCTKAAEARVDLFEVRQRFSFADKNVTDNKCKCP